MTIADDWNLKHQTNNLGRAPPSPRGFSISATIPDGPAALLDTILLMAFLFISKVIGSLKTSTGLSNVSSFGFDGNLTLRRRS